RFRELEVRRGRPLLRDRHRDRLELVADRADAQRVVARLDPRARKRVASLPIADDGGGDRGAGAAGADEHALHRAFFGGGDRAGERNGRVARSIQRVRAVKDDGEAAERRKQPESRLHTLLPRAKASTLLNYN